MIRPVRNTGNLEADPGDSSAAKMGLVTFTRTLAIEGAKYGIKSSVIAPMAASPMTETVMPPDMLAHLKVRGPRISNSHRNNVLIWSWPVM